MRGVQNIYYICDFFDKFDSKVKMGIENDFLKDRIILLKTTKYH